MATEEYSIRVSVDSTDATRAERNLNNLTSSVTQTERALNSTSSAARSSAAALAGLGSSSAGIHSMTAAMSSFARSTAQASSNTQAMSRDVTTLSATTSRSAESMRSLSNAIGLIGLGGFAKDILQTNIEMENLRARLDATFGSMAKGQQAFEDILKIAKETPQSVEEISKSFVMLKNFGIEPTIKVMQDLTNMTSKVGGNADTLSGIVRGLGQAYAKGKLQAEEANQMIERGVPVYALLSKELHKTTAEIMDMMASGEITRPVIEKLIAAMGSSSVGASTKMMETLGGKISMLGDSWHQFENALLGDQSEGLIKRIVDGWMVILDGFTSRMNQSVSAQIVDLKAKLNDAENRKSFLSKGMQSLGLIDSPDQIKNQIAVLQQKRLSDFQANRQYDQSLKQEKATQAEADAIAKKTKANEEFTKKFGTAAQREKQEIDDLKKSMGELTKEQLAQVHAKYFSTTESKAHASALKEIKKEQTEYQRLIESTPYGAYNATIDKLSEGLKRGGEAFRATYATGVEEANKKLLDSTEYVKEHTKALEEQKRALEGTARGTFEKGYSELITQKPYMSDTEYSAKQDKLTADYLTQQQGKDYKTPAEQAKDATSAYDDLNKKLQETATAFDGIGNSSKMAFDGLLGGVSAVAGAVTSFSSEMAQLNDNFQKGSAAYSDFMLKEGTTFEQREKATADYYSMKDKYDSASFKAEITGARQIAGATSKLFGEKSAARKAFHAIEMGMSVIEMAMSAKKMIVDVAAGAARMFSQGGFAGFAGVAAMAAVMGGLGFAMMGGSSKTVDNTIPATKSTGTILGDENANSNSVREIVDTLNDISDKEYPELKAISDGFRGLDNSMYKLNQIIAQSSANFKNTQAIGVPSSPTGAKAVNPNGSIGMQVGGLAVGTAAGALGVGAAGAAAIGLGGASTAITGAAIGTGAAVGAGSGMAGIMVGGAIIGLAGGLLIAGLIYGLGKLLGIGKTKITQMGEGIVINANSLLTNGMLSAVDAQTWRKDEFKTKGWFSSKKRIVETFGALSDDVYESIANTIGGISNVSLMLANELGILDQTAARMEMQGSMPFLKIDWFLQKLKGEDVTKLMNDQLNAYFDRIAENLFKNLLGEFQQIGEGMLQTAARVTTEMVVVKASYKKLGFDVGEASVGLAGFSDRLVQMYNSTADAKDGLKNFIETINDVYAITHTQGQKTQYTITEIKKALTGDTFKNVTGDNFDTAKMFDDAYIRQTLLTLTAKTAALAKSASDSESKVKSMSNAVQDFYTPQKTMGTALADILEGAAKGASTQPAWIGAGGALGGSIDKASWATVPKAWADYFKWFQENLPTDYRAKIADYFDALADVKAKGLAAGGSAISPEQQVANLNAARIASETAAELAKSSNDLTIMAQDLLDKAIPAFTKIQDEYLKTTMSSEKWLQVERDRIIEKEFEGIGENMLDYANLNQITNEMVAQGFAGVTKAGKITAEQMQRFVWSLEDAAKSTKTLSESGKYVTDFSKSISAWIKNIRATTGSPVNQLSMAKANFEEQLKLAKFGATAEEKRAALSGITGYADTYMNAIKSYYATSEKGQKEIEDIMSQVSGLGQSVDVQELQLGALNDIKNGIYDIPKGISDANKILFNDLVTQMNTAGESAKFNPTVENQLRYDALAKIVLMIDKSAKSGADAAFMDKLIASVAGKDSLKTNVNLIINSAEFDAAQKTAIIDNVLASFNEKRLVLNNFEFDVKDAIDAAKMQIAASMGGTYVPSENILPKKENYQLVTLSQADIDMLSKITAAPQSATQTANALPEITVMPQTPAKTVEGSSFLEGKASNLGYGGDYGDIQGMLNFIEYMQRNSYANGGIANQASIFGEAGAEAAVPLPDGRSIPVTLYNASNDSNVNSAETIAELKSQNQKLEILVNTMMATSKAEREKTQELIDAMNGLRTDTRLKAKG
jgi:tape measure domain-containing protein